MENSLEELNKFLEKNNPKKTRAFKVGEEPIPEYARKQAEAQIKIYDSILKDSNLMQIMADFSNSYAARFGLTADKVMAVCLAILTQLIFTKRINAIYEQKKPGEQTPS